MNLSQYIDKLAARMGYVRAGGPRRPRSPGGLPDAGIGDRRLQEDMKRFFDAGNWNRLNADMPVSTQTIDALLRYQLPVLRARSRYLSQTNEYAIKFKSLVLSNVLGACGVGLKSKATRSTARNGASTEMDAKANRAIEEAWWEWSQPANCTRAGGLSWPQVQHLVLGSVVDDGECLIRLRRDASGRYPLKLELIEADQLDHEKNEALRDGGQIRLGVQIDSAGRPVNYWIHKQSPNDYGYTMRDTASEPIAASEIVHAYLRQRINQHRGIPWVSVVAQGMNILGRYEEAELVAARVGAIKCGFIENTGDPKYPGETDAQGNKIMQGEPGIITELEAGQKFVDWDPSHPNAQYADFVKARLRGLSAGLSVSYTSLANDLEAVNYSSGRIGLMEERDCWRMKQEWFGAQVCQPIFEAWLRESLDAGAIPGYAPTDFDRLNSATWASRRWTWVDPLKDVNATVAELRNGLNSHTRILAERGLDEDELLSEIAAFKAKAEGLGLNFDGTFAPDPGPEPVEEGQTQPARA